MKRFFSLIICFILLWCFNTVDVSALDLVTPDEIIDYYTKETNKHNLVNDKVNSAFLIYHYTDVDKLLYSVPYTDTYFGIEYNGTEEEYEEFFYNNAGAYVDLFYLELLSLGYTEEEVENVFSWFYNNNFNEENYDKYGIVFTTRNFTILNDDDTTLTSTMVKKFKVSFDKEKIANLVSTYGQTYNPNIDLPIINFGDVSDSRVTLSVDIVYSFIEDFVQEIPICNIYRSEIKSGDYTLIGTVACDGYNYFYDNDISKGKEYFYKASVVGDDDNYSHVYSTVAISNKSVLDDNPDTGLSIAYVICSLILVSIFATFVVFDHKRIEVE